MGLTTTPGPPDTLALGRAPAVVDYFKQFPGLDSAITTTGGLWESRWWWTR